MPPKVLDVTNPINHKTNKITMIVSNINFLPPLNYALAAFLSHLSFQFLCQKLKHPINKGFNAVSCFTRRKKQDAKYRINTNLIVLKLDRKQYQ